MGLLPVLIYPITTCVEATRFLHRKVYLLAVKGYLQYVHRAELMHFLGFIIMSELKGLSVSDSIQQLKINFLVAFKSIKIIFISTINFVCCLPQAYLMRPSIIFFDEIDGLAPVRSSRQDQIHR